MSSNKIDIRQLQPAQFGEIGSKKYQVQAAATVIYPGEPVVFGVQYVTQMATNKPVVGTDYLVGIAESISTQTASADGIVYVKPIVSGCIYGAVPKVAATWDTQAEYDALVGKKVLLDLTSGTFTALAADSVNNGLIVENLNIKETPSTVAFKFRNKVRYENI